METEGGRTHNKMSSILALLPAAPEADSLKKLSSGIALAVRKSKSVLAHKAKIPCILTLNTLAFMNCLCNSRGQFHESKVKKNSTRRNFSLNFNRLFSTLLGAKCMFTLKF